MEDGAIRIANLTTDGKRLVDVLFREFFRKYDLSAADRYLHPDYIQHDYDFPPGRDGFKTYFTEVFRRFPQFRGDVVHVLEDGDLVAVHGYGVTDPGRIEVLVVDIYQVKDGLLYEHWGTVQQLPPEQFGNKKLL